MDGGSLNGIRCIGLVLALALCTSAISYGQAGGRVSGTFFINYGYEEAAVPDVRVVFTSGVTIQVIRFF
jgi:hypothetical protein